MKIGPLRINVSDCTPGVYLRWWFNGYHYFNFQNGYEIIMQTDSLDTHTTRMFSRISKVQHNTKIETEYSYRITLEGISTDNTSAFVGLLLSEKVEQFEDAIWREVKITRGDHLIKDEDTEAYILDFEITRTERPNTPAVYQRSIKLYIGDTLCDLDDDEIVPINKQVNNIAEMQDRQSDYTAQFRIRKTRAMQGLFELSGEVSASTTFPYENQSCRLVQNSIEMITGGILILDKVDDQYYYVSIYSGNLNFFKVIEDLKLSDLLLPSTNHTWSRAVMGVSNAGSLDYVYPLCEPTDDGGATTAVGSVVGNTVSLNGWYIWPFVKVKAIWDEIFSNVGFHCYGDILTDDMFLKLFIPIVNLTPPNINMSPFMYSLHNPGHINFTGIISRITGGALIVGTQYWADTARYITPVIALYKVMVIFHRVWDGTAAPDVYLYSGLPGSEVQVATLTNTEWSTYKGVFIGEYDVAVVNTQLTFWTAQVTNVIGYSLQITEIIIDKLSFNFPITPRLNLPNMTQVDFIKIICNMFGLVPDVTARNKKITFWSYKELYDNIPNARDWSAYLSEEDDEAEFKFGDYAQNNYLRYKESDDVIVGNGTGIMQIDDETRPKEKDLLEIPISTCDEIDVATTNPIIVSRVPFNTYDADSDTYFSNKAVDPRIVYVKQATGITFNIYDALGAHTDVVDCKIASSLEVAFSSLIVNYAWLSRLLTKTNLRRAKFNLPVYEVAGLKHYIPIYLSKYKAYFYVNKISNFVPGKLCTIDLIKL
jgi:hypothetical protein